jgi:hypothetical protein
MAQQQGLFTTGPSVEDLLQQRNTRALDLQRQLMQGAAQGARDPAKAQAVSFLGSSLGRALAGAMGGEDKELENLKATEAKRQELAGQYGEVVGKGTPAQRLAFGNTLIQNNMGDRGAAIVLQARKDIEEEQRKAEDQLMINIAANDAAILKEEQFNDLQTRSYNIGQQLKEHAPDLASLLMSGQSTDKHEVAGLAALAEKRKAAEAKAKGGAAGGVSAFNVSLFEEKRAEFDKALADGELSQYDYETEIERLSTILGASPNQGLKARREQDYKSVNAYLDDVTKVSSGANKKIQQYEQSIRIIDNGDVYFGTGAEAVDALKKAAVSLGLADDDTDIEVADAAQFRSNTMKSVLDTIEQTKGTTTDTEMAIFKAAGPELSKTKAGNKLILTTALRVAEWEKAKSAAMHEWYVNNPKGASRSAAKIFEKQWKDNPDNKLKFPDAGEIAAAKKPPVELKGDETTEEVFEAFDAKFSPKEEN